MPIGQNRLRLNHSDKIHCIAMGMLDEGNYVTYCIDTDDSVTVFCNFGTSALNYTPTKDGYTFVGWREDDAASGDVLISKVMGVKPITLYAVFKQTVTVTYYDDSTIGSSVDGAKYYNNGNITNPTFVLSQSTKSGWETVGWTTGTAGNSSITYENAKAFERDSNITLYGRYQKTVIVKTVVSGSTNSYADVANYNSIGTTVNPTFKIVDPTKDDWTFYGWTETAGATTIDYQTCTEAVFDSSITIYAVFTQVVKLTTVVNGETNTDTDIRYYNSSGNIDNPKFTVSNPSVSGAIFEGWSTSSSSATVSYSSISNESFSVNTTLYAVFKYSDATLKSGSTSYEFKYGSTTNTVLSSIDGTKYSSISVTAQVPTLECAGWATACSAYATLKVVSGSTEVSKVDLRNTWTRQDNEETEQGENSCPCAYGATATVTLSLSNVSGQNLVLYYEGDVTEANTYISTITAKGKTVVG